MANQRLSRRLLYGPAIHMYRIAQNKKIRDVAAKAKLSASFLSSVESGLRRPTINVLHQIAAALNIPVDHLTQLADPDLQNDALLKSIAVLFINAYLPRHAIRSPFKADRWSPDDDD